MRHGHDCQSSQDSWQDGPIRLVVVYGCMSGRVFWSVSVSRSYLLGRSGFEGMPALWSGSGSYDDKFLRHGHDCQSSQDSWQDGQIRLSF
jgi:hypothetical protein